MTIFQGQHDAESISFPETTMVACEGICFCLGDQLSNAPARKKVVGALVLACGKVEELHLSTPPQDHHRSLDIGLL